jgi:16S rRNA C967 or C1407 C5-methylase (RsmB/RsmF family)
MDHDYLETILEYVKPSFFKDQKLRRLFDILKKFYLENDAAPNLTELKAHLISEEDKQAFKETVLSFQSIDKKYNKEVAKCARIYPHDNDTEGFFVCKIKKVGEMEVKEKEERK